MERVVILILFKVLNKKYYSDLRSLSSGSGIARKLALERTWRDGRSALKSKLLLYAGLYAKAIVLRNFLDVSYCATSRSV